MFSLHNNYKPRHSPLSHTVSQEEKRDAGSELTTGGGKLSHTIHKQNDILHDFYGGQIFTGTRALFSHNAQCADIWIYAMT